MSYPQTGAYNSTEEVLSLQRRRERAEKLALERLTRGRETKDIRVTPAQLDKAFKNIPFY